VDGWMDGLLVRNFEEDSYGISAAGFWPTIKHISTEKLFPFPFCWTEDLVIIPQSFKFTRESWVLHTRMLQMAGEAQVWQVEVNAGPTQRILLQFLFLLGLGILKIE
jgi:hypothetical protein